MPYLQLAYGLVSWATRGLFVGERHVYAVPQIDDLFLASTIFTGGTYRITDADMQALADWQTQARTRPLAASLRLSWAANGSGSQSRPGDPLTAKAVALGGTFAWINHTWDHPILDNQTYADALQEFTRNDTFLRGLGLTPYASVNAVTPNISGLGSADAMRAIHDAGIRQIVGNTSIPGEDNPSPNVGRWNALQPTVLELPRVPTNIGFDTSQPAELIAEYQVDVSKGVPVDYATAIDQTSTSLLRYLLNGSNDPWMFHQANTRDYDGHGHSLLSDLLDATLAKYAAAATFPIVCPTMEDLAQRVAARTAFEGAGLTATIQPGVSITLAVANAATVPVTGLCTPTAEQYGGQTISSVALGAGQSVTLALTGCNAGAGTGGAGGGGGVGAAGSGGTPAMTGGAGAPGRRRVQRRRRWARRHDGGRRRRWLTGGVDRAGRRRGHPRPRRRNRRRCGGRDERRRGRRARRSVRRCGPQRGRRSTVRAAMPARRPETTTPAVGAASGADGSAPGSGPPAAQGCACAVPGSAPLSTASFLLLPALVGAPANPPAPVSRRARSAGGVGVVGPGGRLRREHFGQRAEGPAVPPRRRIQQARELGCGLRRRHELLRVRAEQRLQLLQLAGSATGRQPVPFDRASEPGLVDAQLGRDVDVGIDGPQRSGRRARARCVPARGRPSRSRRRRRGRCRMRPRRPYERASGSPPRGTGRPAAGTARPCRGACAAPPDRTRAPRSPCPRRPARPRPPPGAPRTGTPHRRGVARGWPGTRRRA